MGKHENKSKNFDYERDYVEQAAPAVKSTTDRIPAVAFNTLGLAPTETKFTIMTDALKKYIKEFASTKLDGVVDVSLFAVPMSDKRESGKREVFAAHVYLVLRADSDDLADKEAKKGDTVIRDNIMRISNNLKQFAINYAVGGQDFKVEPVEHHKDLKLIRLDIFNILDDIFDINNKEYKNRYGSDAKGANTLWDYSVRVNASNKGDRDGRRDIDSVTITKRRFTQHKHEGQFAPRKNAKF